jgi:hypothetical protein
MSAETYPMLAGAIPLLESFMSLWEAMAKKYTHLTPYIQPGLDIANKYYREMDRSDAYVIAMCEYHHTYVWYVTDFASHQPMCPFCLDSR